MARLAVLTDRLPNDPSWKGGYIWRTILGLAESQHEVMVFTTEDLAQITVTHPRLNMARPAPSFRVERLPRWTQALLSFRPDIIHTYALRPQKLWPKLSIWPYMDALCQALPSARRISTFFDAEDFSSAPQWHLGSHGWTCFQPLTELKTPYSGSQVQIPFDECSTLCNESESSAEEKNFVLVPAPVSEWADRDLGLVRLSEYLRRNRDELAVINGGWGDLGLEARRQGWNHLSPVSDRVRLSPSLSLSQFISKAKSATRIWGDVLSVHDWRSQVAAQVAHQLHLPELGLAGRTVALTTGSTANSLSRLYLA